jgi:hypothetical protein
MAARVKPMHADMHPSAIGYVDLGFGRGFQMNRNVTLFVLLMCLTAGTSAYASGLNVNDHQCSFNTDYDVQVKSGGIAFTRTQGKPADVFIHDGQLRVDGQSETLSAADAAHLRDFESNMRSLLPDMASIAREAVDIGYSALTTVVATFSENGDERMQMMASLRTRHVEALHRIDDSLGSGSWNQSDMGDAIGEDIKDAVSDLVKTVTGDVVKDALSGDQTKAEALAARVQSLDVTLDKTIKASTDKLSQHAQALCPRLTELEKLQQQFAFRLENGERLQLINPDKNNHNKASQLAER